MPNNIKVKLSSGNLIITKPARIQISMFNPYCTGKYLFALTKWLKNEGVGEIEYQVSDTLQRYNFIWRNRVNLKVARNQSLQAGEQWLTQNSPTTQFCQKVFNKFSVTRWDFWIQQKEFIEKRNFFYRLCENDSGFQAAIDEEIETYFNKLKRSLNPSRKKLSKDFLLEEIAVSEISTKYFPANEIYPGPRFRPEQYLVENNIVADHKIYIKEMAFIHVDFEDNDNAGHHFSNRPHGSKQNAGT